MLFPLFEKCLKTVNHLYVIEYEKGEYITSPFHKENYLVKEMEVFSSHKSTYFDLNGKIIKTGKGKRQAM